MAIILSNVSTAQAGESTSLTIDANVGASDNFIVVALYIDDTSEGAFSSISDEDVNTYDLRSNTSNGNQNLRIYTVSDPTAPNSTDTITVNFTAATDFVIMVWTLQNVDTADPFDHASSGNGTGSGVKTLTFSLTGSDGAVCYGIGQDNNSTVPPTLGTGQITGGSAQQGGGEKTMGASSNEITSASGSNDQTCNLTKTGNFLHAAIELNAEVVTGNFQFINMNGTDLD